MKLECGFCGLGPVTAAKFELYRVTAAFPVTVPNLQLAIYLPDRPTARVAGISVNNSLVPGSWLTSG
jgi:hypothetical protein